MLDAVGKVGSETKCSGANVTQDSKGTKDPQERLVPLAAKMLLRNQHRDNNSGHHSEVKRGYNGTTQRHEPLVLLRETVTYHNGLATCRLCCFRFKITMIFFHGFHVLIDFVHSCFYFSSPRTDEYPF